MYICMSIHIHMHIRTHLPCILCVPIQTDTCRHLYNHICTYIYVNSLHIHTCLALSISLYMIHTSVSSEIPCAFGLPGRYANSPSVKAELQPRHLAITAWSLATLLRCQTLRLRWASAFKTFSFIHGLSVVNSFNCSPTNSLPD